MATWCEDSASLNFYNMYVRCGIHMWIFCKKKMCYNQDVTNANILFLPLPSYIIFAMSLMGHVFMVMSI